MGDKIRVLVVDDSSVIRTLFSKLLARDPEIEVVGVAPDPFVARDKLLALKPDVMTLDIEMPRMDGLTFLGKVMEFFPTRTLIVSSLSAAGSETAYRALESGAIDVLKKPVLSNEKDVMAFGLELVETVKGVASARLQKREKGTVPNQVARTVSTAAPSHALPKTTHQILAIASSTGGTEALKRVLPLLPADIPGTVIVQHMPPTFTKTFARALQERCPFEVKEAEDGDRVIPGRALLAPGNFHMEIVRSGGYYSVKLHQEPPLNGVRPAADFLFRSVAKYVGANAIGVILTGMGRDGAAGFLAMKESGSYNIAQDENSCVVYGMPKEAVKLNAVHSVLPLDEIAKEIIKAYAKKMVAAS